MTDVLVLQNSKIEVSGVLGTLLESDGFSIRTIFEATPDRLLENEGWAWME